MIKNRIFIFIFIGILAFSNTGSIIIPGQPTPPPKLDPAAMAQIALQIQNGEALADEVVVRLQPYTNLTNVEKCAGISESSDHTNFQVDKFTHVIILKGGSILDVLPAIQNCPGVSFAEPNYVVHSTDTTPDDPYFTTNQYGLINIRAPQGWDYSTGSNSVTLAIIDSGMDLNHPDMAGKLVAGYDFVNNDSLPQDDYGHGTHVAGIAAAITNNNYGIAGVSWGALIMPLKVLDDRGEGTTSNSALAIKWAADNGAKVINMSFGTSLYSSVLLDAINYAYSKGVTLVAASGNNNSEVLYPARFDHVIAVGATNSNNTRASFSNYGPELDLVAPGDNIYSTLLNNSFGYMSGTSMASPFVAGLAALLGSLPGEYTPEEIEQAMVESTLDLGETGRDNYYGNGLIQVDGAILQLVTPAPFLKNSPLNSAIDEPTELIFSWENSNFASSYEICVDTSNDDACESSWVSSGLNLFIEANLFSDTTYYWQVRALNSNGITYANSNLWGTFTTESCSILATSVTPTTGGRVELSPAPNCQNGTKYLDGALVGLTAIPTSSNYRFIDWSGDFIGTNATNTILMETDHSLGANFEKSTFDDVPFDYIQTLGGVDYFLYPYIQALWDNGFTNGIWIQKDGAGNITYALYGPGNFLNRGMVAKFLLNVVHGRAYSVPPLPAPPRFNYDDWSNPDIGWAWPWAEELLVEELTNGCWMEKDIDGNIINRSYCPANNSTRAEAAKFGLTMKYGTTYLPPAATGTVFADMLLPDLGEDLPAHWAIAWAEQAYADGLLPACNMDVPSGKPLFCPDEPINRSWSAYLIVKSKELALP